MQRNRAYQNPLILTLFALAFVVYEALGMRELFLPPLFGLLFYFYVRALDTSDALLFFLTLFMLLIAEVSKGFWTFSSVIFYTLSYFLLLPWIRTAVLCKACLNGIIVTYAYLGYWLFLVLMSNMFALPAPHLDWRGLFYIAIEFVIVGLL